MSNIQAVLFDYGLVLSAAPDPAAWERLKQVFGTDEASFHAAYWNYRHDYDRGTRNAVVYWHSVAGDLNATLALSQLEELTAADTDLWTQPNQPMIDWAAALQHAGIKTGILSNLGDAMEAGILARCPWLVNFAHHTFSHRLLIAKPEPAIYQYAADGLAEPPSRILFIDDREENIAAAIAVGMQAIQYSTHKEFLITMRERGYGDLLTP
jgi:putative hydrolase of the HAD superfamily